MTKQQVNIGNAEVIARTDYIATLKAIVEGGFCPFCEEHLFKHHQRPILFRGRHWLATENSWPYEGVRFHYLFIALRHVEKTEDLRPEEWADFHELYRKLTAHHQLTGASLLMRSGETSVTGASVTHLHAQVIVGLPRSDETRPINALVGFKK